MEMKYALLCYGSGIVVAILGLFERTILAFGMTVLFVISVFNTFNST